MGESTNACATLRFWSLGVAPAHGDGGRLGALVDPRGESNRLAVATPAPPGSHDSPHGRRESPGGRTAGASRVSPARRVTRRLSGRQDPCSFAR